MRAPRLLSRYTFCGRRANWQGECDFPRGAFGFDDLELHTQRGLDAWM